MPTSLPDILINIQDGGTGASLPSNSGRQVKIGVSSRGRTGVVAGYGLIDQLVAEQGGGPLAESGAHLLAVPNAGPVYLLPTYPSTFGSASVVTQSGPGAGSVAVALAPDRDINMKVVLGGALVTATVQFSVGGGAYGTPILTSASPMPVPGALVKLTLPAGTYVAGDVYTVTTLGVKSLVGTGPAAAGITVASSPLDGYDVLIVITAPGALGAAQFTYQVDGSDGAPSAATLVPSGGIFAIPGTGLLITFSGTYVAGTTYAFTASAPSLNSTDISGALDIAKASNVDWSIIHVVGRPANASGAATIASVVDTKMIVAEAGFRYGMGVVECPHDSDIGGANDDTAAQTAFATFSSVRTMVVIGDGEVTSQLPGGRGYRRSVAHGVTARLSATSPGTDIAATKLGKVPFYSKLYRDESVFQTLDVARFTTCRSFPGEPGYFITAGRMMAPPASDYTYAVGRRVMDAACRIARQALFKYLNDDLKINSSGQIDEAKAQQIEADVTAQLVAALISSNGGAGDASNVSVTVDRFANLISTGILPVTIKVTPKGYARQIAVTIGYTNPAIVAAA